ncbi:MAG: phospholipase D-like domain-containing protein [Candidatus Nitrosocaldaceae archaeon]
MAQRQQQQGYSSRWTDNNNNKDDVWKWILGAAGVGAVGLLGYYIFQRVYAQPPPPPQPPPPSQLAATLSITPTSGNAPLTVTISLQIEGGSAPYTVRIRGLPTSLSDIVYTNTYTVSYILQQAGTYNIYAEVMDKNNTAVNSNTVAVTVSSSGGPAPPPPPPPPPPTTTEVLTYTREPYYSTILTAIRNATSNIYMHMYLLQPEGRGKELLDALIAAQKSRGVNVRISFTQPTSSSTDPSPVLNYLNTNGFDMSKVKTLSSRAKVLAIDVTTDANGNATSGTAWIGTNNWTVQSLSANEEFNTSTRDTAIVDAAFKFLNILYNAQSLAINTVDTAANQFLTTEYLNRLLANINAAVTNRSRIYATINSTDYNPDNPTATPRTASLIDALVNASSSSSSGAAGVSDMRILLDRTFPSAARTYLKSKLPTGSVKVLPQSAFTDTQGILQAKTFLIGNRLYVSSQNWTNSDLVAARGATISTNQSGAITAYLTWFSNLWSKGVVPS